jgi:endonuclease/exonuclease/phosphatase family metal-dependent hydrolase
MPTIARAAPLRLMTFNLRNGRAPDGDNHWDLRRGRCVTRIAAFDPDLLGVQEAFAFQNEFLSTELPGHAQLGVGRDDGGAEGEFTTILYRRERFDHIASGTCWLSETPDRPGSMGWDATLPRIATWARLRDRLSGGRELLLVNTHLDHQGRRARVEGARLLRALAREHGADIPVLITGDFNAVPGSDPYRVLASPAPDGLALRDAYADATRARPEANDDTFNDFKETPQGIRIDWIFCCERIAVETAAIDRWREGRLFASDHYPVTAVVRMR